MSVGQRLGDRDLGQFGEGSATKRPTAGGDQQPSQFAGCVDRCAQALMDGTVLAVDGNELGTRGTTLTYRAHL